MARIVILVGPAQIIQPIEGFQLPECSGVFAIIRSIYLSSLRANAMSSDEDCEGLRMLLESQQGWWSAWVRQVVTVDVRQERDEVLVVASEMVRVIRPGVLGGPYVARHIGEGVAVFRGRRVRHSSRHLGRFWLYLVIW